jgi:hypothetical protein
MTRARWFAILLLAAIAIGSYTTMPPAARTLPAAPALRTPVRGAIHIHTRRSDGSGTVDEVAGAAARAGLNFVILTDHGDGTREPEPATYKHGVLCIDAVEISTTGGHVVALALPRTSYSLGGETRDVLEDIARLGGISIAAHPSSSRPQLQWTDWNLKPDGLEWVNADSEWRDEPVRAFARTLLTYPFRRPETLATLLDRPEESLHRWDAITAQRKVVAVAGADAHARIPLTSVRDPYNARVSLHVPGYEQIFRTFSIGLPDVMLTGESKTDAGLVLDAIRHGRVFSSIDALAGPVAFAFAASNASRAVSMGEEVFAKGALAFQVKSNAPEGVSVSLLRDGRPVHTMSGSHLEYESSDAGVYRAEMHWPGAPGAPSIPWVVSNPIYVRADPRPSEAAVVPRVPTQTDVRYSNGPATDWHIENSPQSRAALDVVSAVGGGTQLLLRYALGGTESDGPYVALAIAVPQGLAAYDRVIFKAQSSRPARIWVQVRVPGGGQGQSWHRSVYVDETPRTVSVVFDELLPLEATTKGRPALADVRDLLFVVDTVHTRPGMNGQLLVDDVTLAR